MAIFSLHASQKGPRTGKSPVRGNISPPCIQNELALAGYARHVSEKPRKSPFGDAPRGYLARKGPPSLHGPLESCTTRESCHSWVFRLGVAGEVRGEAGRGVPAQRMRLAHCPRLCGLARLFRGFAHMQLRAAPRSRARCSCCRARLCVRRARCPCVRCAYIPCRPMRGKRIRLASLGISRLAVHAPFALRVRFAAARVVDLVGISHEAGTRISVVVSARRPKQRDCVVYRRKRGAVMVFR